MKNILFICFCSLFTISANAQLKVKSNGNVETHSLTYINKGYGNDVGMRTYGQLCLYSDTTINPILSNHIYCKTESSKSSWCGLNVTFTEYNTNASSVGIKANVSGGKNAVSIYGTLGDKTSMTKGAGIYGGTSSGHPMSLGFYAGYFNGDVKATGTIYGTLVSPSSVSSPSSGGETTVVEVSNRSASSVTSKLQEVDLLQMERVNQDGSLPANKFARESTFLDDEGKEVEGEDPVQTKLSAVSYGLAADQLQKVYPELVYEDAEGNYSINYIEMVPLLVQSIKELSVEVTSLKQQLGIAEKAEVKAESEETDDIALVVPEGAKDATLSFFDLSGKQVRTARVTEASSNAKAYTRGLPSGAYVCTLVVDGQVKSSRKIVVNK